MGDVFGNLRAKSLPTRLLHHLGLLALGLVHGTALAVLEQPREDGIRRTSYVFNENNLSSFSEQQLVTSVISAVTVTEDQTQGGAIIKYDLTPNSKSAKGVPAEKKARLVSKSAGHAGFIKKLENLVREWNDLKVSHFPDESSVYVAVSFGSLGAYERFLLQAQKACGHPQLSTDYQASIIRTLYFLGASYCLRTTPKLRNGTLDLLSREMESAANDSNSDPLLAAKLGSPPRTKFVPLQEDLFKDVQGEWKLEKLGYKTADGGVEPIYSGPVFSDGEFVSDLSYITISGERLVFTSYMLDPKIFLGDQTKISDVKKSMIVYSTSYTLGQPTTKPNLWRLHLGSSSKERRPNLLPQSVGNIHEIFKKEPNLMLVDHFHIEDAHRGPLGSFLRYELNKTRTTLILEELTPRISSVEALPGRFYLVYVLRRQLLVRTKSQLHLDPQPPKSADQGCKGLGCVVS